MAREFGAREFPEPAWCIERGLLEWKKDSLHRSQREQDETPSRDSKPGILVSDQELSLHDQKFSLGKQKSCPRTKNLGPRTRILGQRSRILLIQPTELVSETKILLPVTRNLVQRAEFSVREALRVHRRPGIVVRLPEKWLLEQDFCSCNQKNSSAIAEFSYKTI